MGPFYIYELVNSLTGAVFYVGKGKGDRMYHHERASLRGEASKKGHYIREIIRSGGHVLARAVEYFEDEAAAYEAEKELIEVYGLANLQNILAGGNLSPEAVDAIRKRRDQAAANREVRRRAAAVSFLRRWLDSVEGIPLTLPGVKGGDQVAEEFRLVVRDMIGKFEAPV